MIHIFPSSRFVIICFLIGWLMAGWPCSSQADNQGPALPTEEDTVETEWSSADGSVVLSMEAEVVVYYTDLEDESDRHSDDLWDLYLGTLEFSLEMTPSPWLMGQVTAAFDDFGKKDEDPVASISEATLTLQYPDVPIYFVGGKRTQPFGVFEDRLISGTITEDLYEIERAGATLGFAVEQYAFDVSLTLYDGQEVIANLEDFGTHEFSPGRRREKGIESYIVNASFSPIPETLDFSIFYNREPGDGSDNRSVGGAVSLVFSDFVVDAEYIAAIEREDGENGEENLESAWFVGLAFQATESLELATRVEFLDDDHAEKPDGVVKNRYLAGFNYEMREHVTLSAEYRCSLYNRERNSLSADRKNEAQLQFTIEY